MDGLARQHGGRLVKSLGDGAMVHVSNQNAGLSIALEAVSTAESFGLWPLHAGVNSGPMVRLDGDFFGAAVNIASRVADMAGPGEVHVTENIVSAAETGDREFIPLGESQLKNVANPVLVYKVDSKSE